MKVSTGTTRRPPRYPMFGRQSVNGNTMNIKREIVKEWRRRFGTKKVRTYHDVDNEPNHVTYYTAPNRKGSPSLRVFAWASCTAGDEFGDTCHTWLQNKSVVRKQGGGRGARRIGGMK